MLQKSSTNVKIPGHDAFLRRQKEAQRLKREKSEALQNIGRKKREPKEPSYIDPVAPLFDIELNIGNEQVKFSLLRNEDYKEKVAKICKR